MGDREDLYFRRGEFTHELPRPRQPSDSSPSPTPPPGPKRIDKGIYGGRRLKIFDYVSLGIFEGLLVAAFIGLLIFLFSAGLWELAIGLVLPALAFRVGYRGTLAVVFVVSALVPLVTIFAFPLDWSLLLRLLYAASIVASAFLGVALKLLIGAPTVEL